jgi:hypothetical protein
MTRFISLSFFLLALICIILNDQVQALVSLIPTSSSTRTSTFRGQLIVNNGKSDRFQRPELIQESVNAKPQSRKVSSSYNDAVFDTDAYRRQMIDLVYQRSMERFSQ